jgi:tetratricopeptide (TPR) repeat protein
MSSVIHRPVVLTVALAAVVAATSLVWVEVRQEREFRRQIAIGDAAMAQDKTVGAIEAFSGALTLKPASMLAHLKRGDAYRRRGELTAALRDLREAAALDDTAPQPIELLGDVNHAMGRYERAAEHYQRYLQLDDRVGRVFYKLALAQVRNGRPADAIEPLRRALALDDRFAEAHYLLGVSLRAQGQRGDAVRSLARAVALNPAFIAAREQLADMYRELGRTRESIEELEAIAALEPGRPERLVTVGLTYARLGRPESAILTLGRAAERYPETPLVYEALGRVWLDAAASGDLTAVNKALEALAPIAARAGASSETLALYGRALLFSGNSREAARVLQQAVALTPVDATAYRYLAEAATNLGDVTTARSARARHALLAGSL